MTNEQLDMHRPTAEFRDYLEGEVLREYGRRRTFRRLRAAAVIVVSIGVGMTTTLASAQVRENTQRNLLLESARADVALAQVRLDLARTAVAEEWRQVRAGAHLSTSADEAELAMHAAEAEVARAALNIEEIEASAMPPRDELNAPLVKGKDFVAQRLELQLALANRRLKSAEAAQWLADRRVAVGSATELDGVAASAMFARTRADLAIVAAQLKARKEFLEKGTPLDTLKRRIARVEALHDRIIAGHAMTEARQRVELLEKRMKVGAATEIDVLRARLTLKERELEVAKADKRLKSPP